MGRGRWCRCGCRSVLYQAAGQRRAVDLPERVHRLTLSVLQQVGLTLRDRQRERQGWIERGRERERQGWIERGRDR